jgi:hypothetical protein
MNPRYWLNARDKPALFVAIARALVGNAYISFEGDLSSCTLDQIRGASALESEKLKRNTVSPVQDFVIVPLEADTIAPILANVLPSGRIVHQIEHIQILKDGDRQFGAYDNFHPECVVCGDAVPFRLLDHLLAIGVLRSVRDTAPKLRP